MSRPGPLLLSIIVGALSFSALAAFIDPQPLMIMRLVVTGLLCWFLYRKRNWARWAYGLLAIATGVAGLYVLLHWTSPPDPLLLSATSGFYLLSGALLLLYRPLSTRFSDT